MGQYARPSIATRRAGRLEFERGLLRDVAALVVVIIAVAVIVIVAH